MGVQKEELHSAFQGMDRSKVGMINLKDFMNIVLKLLEEMDMKSPQLLDLLLASGAGCVRYGLFLDYLYLESEDLKPRTEEKPLHGGDKQVAALKAQVAELQARLDLKPRAEETPLHGGDKEVAALKAQVVELQARLDSKMDPEAGEPKKVEKKSAQAHYDAAVEDLGGEASLKACRLQSISIADRVKKRPGIQAWEQDPVYLGL